MSDRWIHIQHNEARDRRRAQRLATLAEAERLSGERHRGRQDRNEQGRRS